MELVDLHVAPRIRNLRRIPFDGSSPGRLAVMVFSGLFQERFVDQVQVVGYLHDQMAVEDQSAGGGTKWDIGKSAYHRGQS